VIRVAAVLLHEGDVSAGRRLSLYIQFCINRNSRDGHDQTSLLPPALAPRLLESTAFRVRDNAEAGWDRHQSHARVAQAFPGAMHTGYIHASNHARQASGAKRCTFSDFCRGAVKAKRNVHRFAPMKPMGRNE